MPLTSLTSSISKTSFSLPPITKVFPGHFGSDAPLPTTTTAPNRQNQNLPLDHFKQAIPFETVNSSCSKSRNNSMNFNPSSINYGHLSQTQHYQQQQQQDHYYNYPQHYTQAQINRKRSYHQQGPGTLISEVILPPVQSQIHMQARSINLPPAHNFVSFSTDTLLRNSSSSIKGSIAVTKLTIQV